MTRDVFEDPYYRRAEERFRELLAKPAVGRVEGYELVDQLGGGMSSLLVVRKGGKLWVLKASPEVKNVAREAVALYQINHAFILEADNVLPDSMGVRPYLVLPYCAGGSLRDRMMSAPRPPLEEMVYHLLLTAGSLFLTHRQGWVHRDMKPENVLFEYSQEGKKEEREWETKAADLGLSARAGSTDLPPFFQGTARYAPPEQLRAAPPTLASDMWSWGVMAVEVMTGEHPYLQLVGEDFESHAQLADRIRDAEEQIRQSARLIEPAWLGDIVESCLRCDPGLRPDSREVVRAFGDHCKFTAVKGGGEVGAAGPTPFDYPLRSLGYIVNDMWPSRLGDLFTARFNLKVLNTIRKASHFLSLGTGEPLDEALSLLDGVLGEPNDESSLLSMYLNDPSAKTVEEGAVSVEEGNVHRMSLEVTRWQVEAAIDLKLTALVNRVEARARPEDLEALDRLTAILPADRLDTLPVSLVIHWAQALMHVGYSSAAFEVLEVAMKREPGNLLALATLISFMTWEGMFEQAFGFLHLFEDPVKSAESGATYMILRKTLFAGVMTGKAEEALPILVQIIRKNAPTFDIGLVMMYLVCLHQAAGRLDDSMWGIIRNQMFTIPEEHLSLVRLSVVCAWLYGEHDYCTRRARAALQSRFIRLPVNKTEETFFRHVASGGSPLDYGS